MGLFHTPDKKCYRRWINIIPALLVPGASQFLSGQRKKGFLWLLSYYAVMTLVLTVVLHPATPFVFSREAQLDTFGIGVYLAALLEGLRRPIPVLGFKKGLLSFGGILAILLGPILLIRGFLFQPFIIPTDAMAPTLLGQGKAPENPARKGDKLFVNKAAYRLGDPKRGDVAVFEADSLINPGQGGKSTYIKRVVGLPGERVSLQPPSLLINGERVKEPGIFQLIEGRMDGFTGYTFLPHSRFLRRAGDSYLLKEDEYFVLGDNSPLSADSRIFGPVKRSDFVGKACYIYSPADRKGRIN